MTIARRTLLAGLPALALAGCETAMKERTESRQGVSVMRYLFPDDPTGASMQPADIARLRVPLSIGVAFVPGGDADAVTEVQREQVLDRVIAAFRAYPFVGELKPVPSTYLSARGGFADLERAARMFSIDVFALLSFDQVQFTEKTRGSIWYWTLVGAYMAEGDRYDVHTVMEATIVDVASRRLLFRASGAHVQGGGATMANVAEATRAARAASFAQAAGQMIPRLQASLEVFRQQARAGAGGVRLDLPPGYDPAASRPAR